MATDTKRFEQLAAENDERRRQLADGLTLVKSLVEMHGGTVEARSDGLGKGSEFAVRLPDLSAGEVVPAETDDSADEPRALPRRRILVVDDLRPSAFIVAALLRSSRRKCARPAAEQKPWR